MGRRVLVVEDSRTVNDLVIEALVGNGFECLAAFDGREALELFERELPDALVLDLNIPQIHGLEVLRRVKHQRPFAVVVVLTGHGSEQTAIQALKLGADDYLTKPFREASLVEALELHLKQADLQECLDVEQGLPLGAEERYLARIFFDAPAALVHADPSGAVRGVNRAASRLLARQPRELLGRPIASLVGEEIRASWEKTLRREAGTVRGYEGEVYLDGASGSFPASVVAVERPEPGHLLLVLRDLTRQKAMEKRYFESKRLASLGRVVEGVAHEVRNPLLSIGGFARKLREEGKHSPRERRYLEVVLNEVERLEAMVRDIEQFVGFSRRNQAAFEPVDLAAILREVVTQTAGRLPADGIEFRQELPEDLPEVFGNASLIRDLFEGLVENGCEAMPEGGGLTLSARHVDRWVHVRVEDTGVGIPEEDLDEIFDPFFTSKTSGAGLGLARAYLIVEEHAGTIDFESQLGTGTRCTVSLPVDRRKVPRVPT